MAVGAPAQLSDGWSLRGNAAGSPVAVADQGLQVRPGSGFVARGCYRYLYLEAEDESAPFHTLLLSAVPDDATPAGAGTAAASTSPLAPPAQPLHICCFVSEPRHGRMYGLDDGGLAPLAQYNYVNPTSAAVLNDCLLYVMTSGESGGVDAYTLRCRGPSLASDITFVGSKHLMSPAEISICDLTLAVAVRHGGAATAVAGFNVYSLRQIALDALYDQIIAAGKEQEENWPFYHQILLEGHYMLQAHLAALKRAGSAEAMVRCRAKFSASCLTLGTHLCTRRAAPDWAAAAEFYAASGAPLTAVLARMMPEEVREHASDTTRLLQPGTDPARRGAALLSVCDRVLIDGSSPEACAELDDAEVAAIFKLYFELAPGRLGALATAPTMAGHAPAQVLPLLLALIASEPEPAPALRLGATLLHIGARDVAAAMLLLRGGLVSHCLDWCTRHPELLVRDSHHSPDVCTALGVLLRERFAAEFDALAFGVRSPLSPATAVAALRPAHDAHRRLIGALPAAIASRSAAGDDKGAAVFSHAFIEAGLAVFVPAASGGEAPGWLAPTCARSPASARPIWLDSLPPFDDPGHSLMSPAAMALLGRLQGVLAACCTGGSGAEPFLELVRAASARTCVGRRGLLLPRPMHRSRAGTLGVSRWSCCACLPQVGARRDRRRAPRLTPPPKGRCDEALRTLLRVCPAAVPGYARAHLPATGHCGRWRSLLQTVVALHELSTRGGSEAGRGTGGGALLENKGDSGDTIGSIELGRVAGLHNAGAGASTYRMVCRAMLELIAERVSPVELLDALPENGAVSAAARSGGRSVTSRMQADFFVPYLARALEAQSARTMGQDINGLAAAVE